MEKEDPECVLEGQLDKEGRIAKATKPRWFVLTSTMLTYYTDRTKSIKKESMYLTTDSSLSPIETHQSVSKSTRKHKFTVTGMDPNMIALSMTVVSTDEDVIKKWYERIEEVKGINKPGDVVSNKQKSDSNSGKNSTSLRMKKFMASKLAGSSVGQDVIANAVDEETRNIIGAFITAVKKYAGEAESQKIKEHCFKIVTKLAVLYQNKVMQVEDFMVFSHFMDGLVVTLSRILMQIEDATEPVVEGSELLEKYVDKLVLQFEHFQSQAVPILQKYMKESNSARLTHLKDAFAQKPFLRCILIGNEYNEVRLILKDMLYS